MPRAGLSRAAVVEAAGALADEIRNGLRDLGIAVEDRPDGAIWRREAPPSQ